VTLLTCMDAIQGSECLDFEPTRVDIRIPDADLG